MSAISGKDPTVRNVFVLALCQALSMSSQSLLMTISAIVGNTLAPDPVLATFPLALQFLAMMLTTLPASLLMERYGRRFGFTFGALLGAVGGGLSMLAVFRADFTLLCIGALFLGAFAGHAIFYRFAAADTASEAFRSRAISLVLAGGVVAAIVGPELAKQGRDLLAPVQFAGAYLAIIGLCLATMVLLRFIEIPRPRHDPQGGSGRPLLQIMRQPTFVVAVLCAMVGYGTMNLVMVSTPLAMVACQHPFESAALVIQLHVLGMYAPSFFTGSLIQRIGVRRVLAIGGLLVLGCVVINVSGVEVLQFAGALVLLGLGWNFLFVGGSALLTETYRPEEKAKVQAVNDFLVFGTVALTAFSSGAVHDSLGWTAVNLAVVVPVLLALASVVWLGARRPAPVAA